AAVEDLNDRVVGLADDVEETAEEVSAASADGADALEQVAALSERVDQLAADLHAVTAAPAASDPAPEAVPVAGGLAPGTPVGPSAEEWARIGVVLPDGTFMPSGGTLIVPTSGEVTARDVLE